MVLRRAVSRSVVLLLVLFAGLAMGVAWQPATVSAAPSYIVMTQEGTCLNTQEAAFLKLINDYRAAKGLGKLTATKSLNAASFTHSQDMGKRRYFSHTTKSPLLAGQTGASPWDRMRDAGYGYNTYKGENIAAGQSTAQAVFNAWKASSGHNANMLNPKFKAIGIGLSTVSGSPYTNYWTTDFGGVIDASPAC